ncbi:hypothetical protein DPX16_2931 [Anabarilius grahami]|uniref:Uncharacterized protein n=1 Tax=Anabarilius grahami TaxID=495550 RepID=A0A3N0Y5D6_ANAGA|nr:hypothetical protein DPX16_2931 [Anabarilius grahami]
MWRITWNSIMRPAGTLQQHIWSGMDDILGQLLLLMEDHFPFMEFVDYALWVCGSSLTVGVVKDNDTIISDTLGLSTPPAAISLPAPEKTLRLSPECPGMTAIPVMMPMPATESEPEPAPATDPELEPPPCPELMPATESTTEPEQVAAPVPRLEPIARFSEESGPERQFSDEPLLNSALAADPLQLVGWFRCGLPGLRLRLNPPPLQIHRDPYSLRFHLGPRSFRCHPLLPGPCLHLGHSSRQRSSRSAMSPWAVILVASPGSPPHFAPPLLVAAQ